MNPGCEPGKMGYPKNNSLIRNSDYFILSLLIAVAALVLLFIPGRWLNSGSSWCLHYRLLGVQCPFCGSTRGAFALLHGHIVQALRLNFNILLLALLCPVIVWRAFSQHPLPAKITRIMLWVLLAGYVLLYISRITGADRLILSR